MNINNSHNNNDNNSNTSNTSNTNSNKYSNTNTDITLILTRPPAGGAASAGLPASRRTRLGWRYVDLQID